MSRFSRGSCCKFWCWRLFPISAEQKGPFVCARLMLGLWVLWAGVIWKPGGEERTKDATRLRPQTLSCREGLGEQSGQGDRWVGGRGQADGRTGGREDGWRGWTGRLPQVSIFFYFPKFQSLYKSQELSTPSVNISWLNQGLMEIKAASARVWSKKISKILLFIGGLPSQWLSFLGQKPQLCRQAAKICV